MNIVKVYYRQESDGAWIATSPEVPGYMGHGDSFEQAADRVREGLPWFAEAEGVAIVHVQMPDPDATGGPKVTLSKTPSTAHSVPYAARFVGADVG